MSTVFQALWVMILLLCITYIYSPLLSFCIFIHYLPMPQRGFSIFSPSVLDEDAHLWCTMYALMESKKAEDAIKWALQSLLTFCPELRDVTATIFSDKGLSEKIVHEIFGAHVAALLCRYHIGLNLASNLSKLPRYVEVMHRLKSSFTFQC